MNKICTNCHQEKSIDEFAWKDRSVGKKSSHCKVCQKQKSACWYNNNKLRHQKCIKANNKLYLKRNKDFVWEYLLCHPCIICGESDPIVLEFDHRDPKEKHKSVCELMLSKGSLDKLKKEVEKCDVRCANCHRRKTAKQLNWWIDHIRA